VRFRYRRHLGRTTLARGTRPKSPKISYSGFGLIGCLVVGVALPLLLTALFAVIVAVCLAMDVSIALGVLLLLRSFRNWVLPAFRGEPFDSRSLAKTSPVATFAMGAVPTGALALPLHRSGNDRDRGARRRRRLPADRARARRQASPGAVLINEARS